MSRIEQEKVTVKHMIEIYCRANHNSESLCSDCDNLLEYAYARLDHCKFGENKTTCKKCPVHCYKPDMREKMRIAMRYAGPRMIIYHPIAAIKHIIREMK